MSESKANQPTYPEKKITQDMKLNPIIFELDSFAYKLFRIYYISN